MYTLFSHPVTVFLTSFIFFASWIQKMSQKVVFLGMGGTIAGRASRPGDNVGYKAGQVGVADLLQCIPALQDILGKRTFASEQVAQLDSKDMDHATWLALALRLEHYLIRDDVAGIVVTHGTDTLEETAYFLSRVLPAALQSAKPVVLTCAMRPATSTAPDGPQNVSDATSVVCSGQARGVMVVHGGEVHAAARVQKVHPYRLNAFDSGESGPLGFVEEGQVRLLRDWPAPHDDMLTLPEPVSLATRKWPRVEIVISHAGASGAMVRSLLSGPDHVADPVRGLVIAGTGNGTIHKDMMEALRIALRDGVRVVRTSRCAYGQIVCGPNAEPDPIGVASLSPVKARIALMLDLMQSGAA
jgi:L-asparaginase